MGLDLLVRNGNGADVYAERIGSYYYFHEFRLAWARHLGFDLGRMEGFGGSQPWTTEPLQSFFDHSDCEETIAWQDAKAILKQARKDVPKLPEFHRQFQVLIAACQAAVEHRTPIIFC